jgi:hypothetical protein
MRAVGSQRTCRRCMRVQLSTSQFFESNRILGVSTAQWRQVDLQTQLQTARLDAEGADRRCFGIEQSIFAAPPPGSGYSPNESRI